MILTKKDFQKNMALVNLNQLFDESKEMANVWAQYAKHKDAFPLYEVTRGAWVRRLENVKGVIEYVMPVYKNEILEVYKVAGWFLKDETMRSADLHSTGKSGYVRVEFVGNIAPEEIRQKYFKNTVEGISFQNPLVTFLDGAADE